MISKTRRRGSEATSEGGTSEKVVFLDIDGVLNSSAYLYDEGVIRGRGDLGRDWASMIDTRAVERLNRIIEATGAKVVISSSWRILFKDKIDALARILRSRGLVADVIGRTPVGSEYGVNHTGQRGFEVALWLSKHPVAAFVILDDSSDFDGMMDRLVRTPWSVGLQDEHVARAIALLLGD